MRSVRAEGGAPVTPLLYHRPARLAPERMPSAPDLFTVVHLTVLAAFVGVTSVSMLVAVVSRLRIRRPLLVWREGPLSPIPLGPSLFLLLVAGGGLHAWWTGRPVAASVLIGYPAGGVFWFIATWLVRSVVVTEYGLIPNVHRLHQAVTWSQIVDYFTTTRSGQPHFVFFFRDDDGQQQRLDLTVPEAKAEAFRDLVQRKLDSRFRWAAERAEDEIPMDRPDDPLDSS